MVVENCRSSISHGKWGPFYVCWGDFYSELFCVVKWDEIVLYFILNWVLVFGKKVRLETRGISFFGHFVVLRGAITINAFVQIELFPSGIVECDACSAGTKFNMFQHYITWFKGSAACFDLYMALSNDEKSEDVSESQSSGHGRSRSLMTFSGEWELHWWILTS